MALIADTQDMLDPMTPVPYRVARLHDELSDTFTLELEPIDHDIAFEPGQFTMLYIFGVGEVPISVSGDPGRRGLLVQTVRAVGPVTDALQALSPGHFVGVRGPFGTSWPMKAAEGHDVVIMGGGIGLAPLRPAIYHVLNNRDRYKDFVLLYGARSPQELLYAQELQEWGGRFDMTVLVTVDVATRGWTGSVGVVTKLVGRGPYDADDAVVFLCGPGIMMRYGAQSLIDQGVSTDRIYVSMERNMKCAVGFCGHCQFGPTFICKDGPVFPFGAVEKLIQVREV
jgi:NAD(P)H-flavin reductase